MKMSAGKIASHGMAFAAALGIAWWFSAEHRGNEADDSGKDGVGENGRVSSNGKPDRTNRPGSGKNDPRVMRNDHGEKYTSAEFKAAWDAIAFREISLNDRTMLQEAVLRGWAEVDMEAALKALLSTNWDMEEGFAGVGNMLESFNDVFRERPLEVWDLIQSGRLGLGGELVKSKWAAAAASEHPMLVMSVFSNLSSGAQGNTLKQITAAVAKNPELREQFLEQLCKQPQTGQFSTWMSETIRSLGPSAPPDVIGKKLSEAKTEQERTRYIHEFGLALKKMDFPTMMSEWTKLPEDLRGRTSRSLLLHADPSSDIPSLAGEMMKIGEWKSLNEQAGKISEYGYKTGKVRELAEWTSGLPAVAQSQEIFVRAVEPFIVNKPSEARQWIESMASDDWRRDRALAEYSRHVLWRMNDKDLSTWAIDSISDPMVKRNVVMSRQAWAHQKGVDP